MCLLLLFLLVSFIIFFTVFGIMYFLSLFVCCCNLHLTNQVSSPAINFTMSPVASCLYRFLLFHHGIFCLPSGFVIGNSTNSTVYENRREGLKNPSRRKIPLGGQRGTPFSANFFPLTFWQAAFHEWGRGGKEGP